MVTNHPSFFAPGGLVPPERGLDTSCPFDAAPRDVALGFLNNLAFVHGMKPMFQYGGFVGTVGEYDSGAVASDTALRRGKFAGGAMRQGGLVPKPRSGGMNPPGA